MRIDSEAPALFTLFLGLVSRYASDNSAGMVAARAADARTVIGQYFDGATFHDAAGFWKGTEEPTLVVSILGKGSDETRAGKLAAHLARTFRQDCVALSVAPLAMVRYIDSEGNG